MSGRQLKLTGWSFAFILIVFFVYRIIISMMVFNDKAEMIPVIAGKGPDPTQGSSAPEPLNVKKVLPLLPTLFPEPNDWRCETANLIFSKSRDGFLLFKDIVIAQDQRSIILNSCNIIILGGNDSLPESERYRQAIIVETTGRTTFNFSRPVKLEDGLDFGSFEDGSIDGQVIIHSQMAQPGPEDDFLLRTRGISFNTKQILANNEVDFLFSGYKGDGQGLTIDINIPFFGGSSPAKENAAGNPIQKIQEEGNLSGGASLERFVLTQLNRLQFGLDQNVFQRASGKPDPNSSSPGKSDSSPADRSIVDITCQKGLYVVPNPENQAGWVARFMEDVEVHVFNRDEKQDKLTCRNLYLYFMDQEMERLLFDQKNQDYLASLKKKPTGRLALLSPVKFKAVRSSAKPARVEAPQYDFNAEGDEIVYDLVDSSIYITSAEGSQKVRLTRQGTSVFAEGIRYEFGSDGQFGTIVAGKNGSLDSRFEQGKVSHRLQAKWKQGLRISPEPSNRSLLRMALTGGMEFQFDEVGRVQAEEADIWLAFVQGAPNRVPAEQEKDLFRQFENITPHSAQFRGNIKLLTEGGSGFIKEEMSLRFRAATVPVNGNRTADASPGTAPASGTAPADPPLFKRKQSLLGGNTETEYTVNAQKLDLWILQESGNIQVDQIMFRQNVLFQELSRKDRKETVRIQGDQVIIQGPDSQNTTLDLMGNNAVFVGKGLKLSGYHVNINRASNSFSVLGPGRLSFMIEPKKSANSAFDLSGPMDVVWSQKMTFNGQTLSFLANESENVVVSHSTHTLKCPEIRLSIKEPVSIFDMEKNPNGTSSLLNDLAVIECIGTPLRPVQLGLFLIANRPDARIRTSNYQAMVNSFILDYTTKDFTAQGPGWIRATMKNPDEVAKKAEPVNASAPEKKSPLGDLRSQDRKAWGHLHLTFQESLSGNIVQKNATVLRRVQTVYCETDQQETNLDVQKPETFADNAITVDCNELQMLLSPGTDQEEAFELRALGNVLFRYTSIVGRGSSVVYSNLKRRVQMKGDSVSPASIFKQERPGAPTISIGRFLSGTYYLDTERLDVEALASSNGQ
ncbi:MAG: hypothetical protein Q4G69_02930 [Planctomycetia bacterium]|nr:hypothetical protein [Planctomycetia bacterium]